MVCAKRRQDVLRWQGKAKAGVHNLRCQREVLAVLLPILERVRLLDWLLWHGNYSEFPNSSIVGLLCDRELWPMSYLRRILTRDPWPGLNDGLPVAVIWAAIFTAFGFMLGYLVG